MPKDNSYVVNWKQKQLNSFLAQNHFLHKSLFYRSIFNCKVNFLRNLKEETFTTCMPLVNFGNHTVWGLVTMLRNEGGKTGCISAVHCNPREQLKRCISFARCIGPTTRPVKTFPSFNSVRIHFSTHVTINLFCKGENVIIHVLP